MAPLFWMSLAMFFLAANCTNDSCGGDYAFHGDLTAATVQVSNWLREYYHGNFTPCEPHITSYMMASLRLAGHHPKTLLSDFKDGNSLTVVASLKAYLDKQQAKYKSLSGIPVGQMAFIVQGTLALCLDSENFFGYNLVRALTDGLVTFKVPPNNYFEYSAIILALCQSGITVSRATMMGIKKFILAVEHKGSFGSTLFPDTKAMAVMALSCLNRSVIKNTKYKSKIDTISGRLICDLTTHWQQQNLAQSSQKTWNVHSISLVLQALMTSPTHLKPEHWKKEMKRILKEQDDTGSFGSVLANIQVLPALVGRSLVNLDHLACPHDLQVARRENISVCVKLTSRHSNGCEESLTSPVYLTVPERTTAYDILKLAAKINSNFQFTAKKFSFGRMITTISVNVKEEPDFSWMLYSDNNSLSTEGVDVFTPENNTCIVFKYEKYGQQHNNENCPETVIAN